ncbi:MAG: transcription elongation factor GreA [SAR324 cluster bacterium]|nr:transcription elongation factor GreA [SAR324 cluster bacterium]
MSERIPITQEGLDKLKSELHHLLSVERPGIQKAIAEAREHGDLRENAEFHAAKERQSFIEGRIQEINARLAYLYVVDPADSKSDSIAFGATVTIENLDTEESYRYQIVGPDEADMQSNRISFQSPIAKALIGNKVGDVVTVLIPKGKIEVEITEVLYR